MSQTVERDSAGAVGTGCTRANAAPARTSGRRVLLAEHDAPLRAGLAAALEDAGYEAVSAGDGLEGWCVYEVEHPELVVLDLDMPCISGFRLLRLLLTQTDTLVPIIVVTSGGSAEPRNVASSQPAAYLRKPFAPQRLVQRVHQLLTQRA